MGLTFENLDGQKSSKMAATLLVPPTPPQLPDCTYDTVNARMPLPTPDPTQDQVCTRFRITAVDTDQLQVRLPGRLF